MNTITVTPSIGEAAAVIDFWTAAGPSRWFAKNHDFDRVFRERFLGCHEAASRGALDHWLADPIAALALVLLLDQYPRNAFRNTARMYDTDVLARAATAAAIRAGHDRLVPADLAVFFYLPFGHSESLADQEKSAAWAARLGEPHASRARHHRDLIARFGRFPHRNAILGRSTTAAEQLYLDKGGYQG